MASHGINWVPGTHVRFRDQDFIITVGGELALAHAAIQPLPSIGLNYERLERQLGVSLGPQLSREDQRRLTFSDANDMAWLAGGEPYSLKHRQLARQVVRIMTISLSATFHCSWPIQHEHGWNTFRPIESKVGRT